MKLTDNKGLTVFELNSEGQVKKADYRPASIFISFSQGDHSTNETFFLVEREGCRYVKALNKKNAIRKFKLIDTVTPT